MLRASAYAYPAVAGVDESIGDVLTIGWEASIGGLHASAGKLTCCERARTQIVHPQGAGKAPWDMLTSCRLGGDGGGTGVEGAAGVAGVAGATTGPVTGPAHTDFQNPAAFLRERDSPTLGRTSLMRFCGVSGSGDCVLFCGFEALGSMAGRRRKNEHSGARVGLPRAVLCRTLTYT